MIPIAIEEAALGGELSGSGEITGLHIDSRRVGRADFVAHPRRRVFLGGRASAARRRSCRTTSSTRWRCSAGRCAARASSASPARPGRRRRRTSSRALRDGPRTVWTEGSYAALGVPDARRLGAGAEIHRRDGHAGLGQIAALCEIVRPHVGVISAVGPVHLELVGSRRRRRSLQGGGSSPPCRRTGSRSCRSPRTSSRTSADDIEILRVPPVDVELREDGAHVASASAEIRFPLTSRHQAQNALA